MLPPIAPFPNPKSILRLRMQAERKQAAKNRTDAAGHAARLFLENISLTDDPVIALYFPMKTELETWPLVEELCARNISLVLPVVEKKQAPLVFRRYRPGDALIKEGFGTSVPAPDQEVLRPDILVTPLLAFTRTGGRLGYGGGYYDRTLESLRKTGSALAVGYAYGAQQVDALPLSPLDQPLDWIITEREAIRV